MISRTNHPNYARGVYSLSSRGPNSMDGVDAYHEGLTRREREGREPGYQNYSGGETQMDTSSTEYTLRISKTEALPEPLADDGVRFVAVLNDFPLKGYGETAVEAAVEVVAHYVEDPQKT